MTFGATHRDHAQAQMTLEEAITNRDTGMTRADEAAHVSWKYAVDKFAEDYLRRHPTLFVDDLWDTDGFPQPAPDRARALGPRIVSWAKRGWIRRAKPQDIRTGRILATSRPSVRSNLSHKPVWVSLIYQEEQP